MLKHSGSREPSMVAESSASDPVATLCAFLLARCGWSRSRIAAQIGVPPLVVEECIRNGVSSMALRSQLANWIIEAKSDVVPPALAKAVLDAAPLTNFAESLERGDPIATLDSATRAHFTELEGSVGHSFISILNDPRPAAVNTGWGAWLGGVVSAMDYSPTASWRTGSESTAGASKADNMAAHSNTAESSDALLARYGLQEDYNAYLSLVSAPYNRNRAEGRILVSGEESRSQLTQSATSTSEDLPWPSDTPAEFFSPSYNLKAEVELLQRCLAETNRETETEAEMNNRCLVSTETFAEDFEAIESRMRDLRHWESTVEGCLLQHVQSRSEQFFAASHAFGDRAGEARETMGDLQRTRADVVVFGQGVVHEMMNIAQLYRGRNCLRSLCAIAEVVTSILSQLTALENWVALPERDMTELPAVVTAFNTLQSAIEGKTMATTVSVGSTQRRVTSTHLSALRDVPNRVVGVKESLSTMITTEVESVLIPHNDSSRSENGTHAGGGNSGVDEGRASRALTAALQIGLWNATVHLCRTRLVEYLWVNLREAFIAFLMSRCELSDQVANDLLSTAETTHASREEKLSLLAHSSGCRFPLFMDLLSSMVNVVLEFVAQAAQRWGFLLLEYDAQRSEERSLDDREKIDMGGNTRKFLTSICTSAEASIALILEVRSHGKTPTNVRELEALASLGSNFMPSLAQTLQEMLALCVPGGDSRQFLSGKLMKSAISRLAKEYFKSYHTESLEKLRMTIEGETWQPEESIDAAFQSCVDTICRSDDDAISELRRRAVFKDVFAMSSSSSSGTKSRSCSPLRHPPFMGIPPADSDVVSARKLLLPSRQGCRANTTTTTTTTTNSNANHNTNIMTNSGDMKNEKSSSKVSADTTSTENEMETAGVEGRVVSRSLLILVEVLREYDDFLCCFPFLAFDVMGKVYDLLKLYVSQCAALLLGAMAVESGVLKTITTQHMAVASQNLGFLFDGIPLMQRRWERAVVGEKIPTSVAEDFERVRRDSTIYRSELFGNTSALVREKVAGLGAVPAQQWGTSGNEWVMTMLREVARLTRALRPLLPPDDMRGVVVPLLGTFARMIRTVTSSPELDTELRAAMASDVRLFKANVERFGFDVVRCADLYNATAAAMSESVRPTSTEGAVLAWFFPNSALS